jgi:hypothetical protein
MLEERILNLLGIEEHRFLGKGQNWFLVRDKING